MARIIFMGTPEFAVPTLRALIAAHDVVMVITQPDRPAGRKNILTPPPIKLVAQEHGIEVFQPEKIRAKEAVEKLQAIPDLDAFVVAAFGQILPQRVLDIPRYGSINVHASLLPRWRGAAPIQAVVRAGDPVSGITIMKMDAGLDTGPMLSQRDIVLAPDETGESLHDKLSVLGAELLIDTLPAYFDGTLAPQAQDDSLATLAPRIAKEEGRIDWSQPAISIERTVRAFKPWPGTYTLWQGQPLKILWGTVATHAGCGAIGEVVRADGLPCIVTGDGLFCPTQVQMAGKNPVSIDAFVNGYPDFIGAVLG